MPQLPVAEPPCNYKNSNESNSVRNQPLPNKATPKIYVLSKNSPRSLNLTVILRSATSLCPVTTSALLDSGATGMFVNRDFVQKHNIETTPLLQPIPVHNVDGTLNENGLVTEEAHVLLQIGSHQEHARLVVTNLG